MNWRRQSNRLVGLRINGLWVEDPTLVKNGAKEYFEQKFNKPDDLSPTMDGVPFRQISLEDRRSLVSKFDPSEVKEAVWECGNDKSPGPDRMNFRFIKSFWHLFAEDFQRFRDEFHTTGRWGKGCNSSLLTLNPKKECLSELSDFCPIPLIGCAYKVASKILANRIKKVLPSIFDDSQSAFLAGRIVGHHCNCK